MGKESEARTLLEDVVGPGEVRVPKDAFWLGHLHLLAEICAALGDAARAGVLLEALRPYASRQIVAGRDGVSLYGSATRDLGLLAATAGDVEAAASFLEQAIEHNERMGSRPWAAQARCDYARMLLSRRGTGDAERAAGLLRAALDVARELGMEGLEEEILRLRPPDWLVAKPETPNTFRREGDSWLLIYAGRSARLRDSKGLYDIAALLAAAGREIHVADLVAFPQRGGRRLAPRGEGGIFATTSRGGDILDARARSAYRARLVELQDDLDEAERREDSERVSRARAEMDAVSAELASALGLGGRPRRSDDPVERARKAVSERVRYALRRIDRQHRELARHLEVSIKTGTFCSYAPEHPVAWRL